MRAHISLVAATAAALFGCRETPEALQGTGGVALDVRVGERAASFRQAASS